MVTGRRAVHRLHLELCLKFGNNFLKCLIKIINLRSKFFYLESVVHFRDPTAIYKKLREDFFLTVKFFFNCKLFF